MLVHPEQTRSRVVNAIYALLNPIPYGFFVAALIFDAIYARSGEILWVKSAAWLIALGLIFAILPRFINLFHVWKPSNRTSRLEKADFWVTGFGILTAIANAFVHSRDAYATMPDGLYLSIITIILLSLGLIFLAVQHATFKRVDHA